MTTKQTIQCLVVTIGLLAAAGCTRPNGDHMEPRPPAQPGAADHSRLQHYQPAATDAPWLAKAAGLHGHLGPWVAIGAMIGDDAIQRLQTPGQWEIEVICWMPPDRQRPPFTCILDGLQASSGATLGKQNIRMDFDPAIVQTAQPVVYIVHKTPAGTADRGLRYDIGPTLAGILARSSPERVEQIAREIAGHRPDELFTIQPIPPERLADLRLAPGASAGKPLTR
jgi:hypothetical protein